MTEKSWNYTLLLSIKVWKKRIWLQLKFLREIKMCHVHWFHVKSWTAEISSNFHIVSFGINIFFSISIIGGCNFFNNFCWLLSSCGLTPIPPSLRLFKFLCHEGFDVNTNFLHKRKLPLGIGATSLRCTFFPVPKKYALHLSSTSILSRSGLGQTLV